MFSTVCHKKAFVLKIPLHPPFPKGDNKDYSHICIKFLPTHFHDEPFSKFKNVWYPALISYMIRTILTMTKGENTMKTRITELLGIKHPIMLAGMAFVSLPKLVAAVSAAGGIGMLNSVAYTPNQM